MRDDLRFARDFALKAGEEMVRLRATTGRRKKLDRTDVTDADVRINENFIRQVARREGRGATVRGEEKSSVARGATRVWTIDPIDGTGEYIDDSVPDRSRTTCIGITLFVKWRLALSVVHNPFRDEMFTVSQEGPVVLNGRPLAHSVGGPRSYDYCHWDNAPFDVRGLESVIGKPRGCYSAIYQACEVVMGRSSFAVFPGDTLHDIAPAAHLVARRGQVTDLQGRRLVWSDLKHGVLYAASPTAHNAALRAIARL
jgi:fructose-1,6-bisphosphatase/inositol monophosphatase family enzyme